LAENLFILGLGLSLLIPNDGENSCERIFIFLCLKKLLKTEKTQRSFLKKNLSHIYFTNFYKRSRRTSRKITGTNDLELSSESNRDL